MIKKNITILSAHKGANAWIEMLSVLEQTSEFRISHFCEFDDEYYRCPRTFFSRIVLRLRTFIVFTIRIAFSFSRLNRDTDIFICVTSPFFLPVLLNIFPIKLKGRRILLMNDIYPEALVVKNIVMRGSKIETILKKLFNSGLNYFNCLVFISENHKRYFNNLGGLYNVVIPISGNVSPFINVNLENNNKPRFIYSGTLGLMHETSTFLSWLSEGEFSTDSVFSFYTSGASKLAFENRVKKIVQDFSYSNIFLYDSLPHQLWVKEMLSANVGLVFQSKGSGSVIFPSKVASNLAAGHAILAVAERDSELANLVIEHDCGWVVEPGDTISFGKAVRSASNAHELFIKRSNSLLLARSMFSESVIAAKWTNMLRNLYHC